MGKHFDHGTNLDNYSNRMFFNIFPERKIFFLTCEEKLSFLYTSFSKGVQRKKS